MLPYSSLCLKPTTLYLPSLEPLHPSPSWSGSLPSALAAIFLAFSSPAERAPRWPRSALLIPLCSRDWLDAKSSIRQYRAGAIRHVGRLYNLWAVHAGSGRHPLHSWSFPHLHSIHQPAQYQPGEWGVPGSRSNPQGIRRIADTSPPWRGWWTALLLTLADQDKPWSKTVVGRYIWCVCWISQRVPDQRSLRGAV